MFKSASAGFITFSGVLLLNAYLTVNPSGDNGNHGNRGVTHSQQGRVTHMLYYV